MVEYNGGFSSFEDSVVKKTFFRASNRATKTMTIKAGQVLKAKSFLETDVNGKAIAHSGNREVALVTFPASIATITTVIIGGLTFTAGAGAVSQATLVAAWKNLSDGTGFAAANTANPVAGGSFTAGTLTGYFTEGSDVTGATRFVSTSVNAGVTDLTVTGTGAASTVAISALADPINKIAGVNLYDINASAADVEAEVYTEASFWADALIWSVNSNTDTIKKVDGTTIAVTPYNTGCAGTTAASNLLKKKFVENSNFEQLGFLSAGETL